MDLVEALRVLEEALSLPLGQKGLDVSTKHRLLEANQVLRQVGGSEALAAAATVVYNFYEELGLTDDSVVLLQQAVQQDSANADARWLLACALFDQRRYRAAMHHLMELRGHPALGTARLKWMRIKLAELLAICLTQEGEPLIEQAWKEYLRVADGADEIDLPVPIELHAHLGELARVLPPSLMRDLSSFLQQKSSLLSSRDQGAAGVH